MKVENQLLARLTRALTGAKPEAIAPVEVPVELAEVDVVTQAVEAAQALEAAGAEHLDPTDAVEMAIAEAVKPFAAEVIGLTAKLDEMVTALADMTARYENANAVLDVLVAEKAALEVAAAVAKATARKEKVEAAIGTEKAAGLLLATQGLDDASFEAVVAALAGSVDAEAKSPLFQEVGATGVVDAAKIVEESAEMKILKAKYPGAK